MSTETISEAFDLVRQYAEREGWIPIGWRAWQVGPWNIIVNGTPEERDHVLPYHALITHEHIVALMLINPFRGTVGGWQGAEDEFIADMRAALATPQGSQEEPAP